jgi:acyl dehydratase
MWARTGEFRSIAIAFLGISDWRFLRPIFLGDTIFVGYSIESLRDSASRPTQAIATFDVKVTNQDGVVVQAGKKALLLSKTRLAAIEAGQVQEPAAP